MKVVQLTRRPTVRRALKEGGVGKEAHERPDRIGKEAEETQAGVAQW